MLRGYNSNKDVKTISEKEVEDVISLLENYDSNKLETINYKYGDFFVSIQQKPQSSKILDPRVSEGGNAYLSPQHESFSHQDHEIDSDESGDQSEEIKPIVSGYHLIKATMSGSFYIKPNPEASAFVKEGDTVVPGQVLCLLEAMKLFTEVKADIHGIIKKIIFKQGDIVKEGDTLLEIAPQG